MAPLLPKLRGHFAEFLNHSSLERLGILYLTTCVGFGYGPQQHSLEAFLGSMGSPYFASIGYASPLTHPIKGRHPDLPGHRATSLHQDNHRLAGLPSCVTPSLAYYRIGSHAPPTTPPEGDERGSDGQHHRPGHGRTVTSTGISTRCPSTTPVGLALGPDLPWADQLDPGTLSQSAHTFLTCVSLLMPAFSLVNRPPLASAAASPGTRRSPTHPSGRWPSCWNDTTSAVRLSPATLSARNHLTSELLRTLSRMAASKPTSWLSGRPHILSHLAHA